MHLLAATPGVVSDGSEAVDLGQTPGDIVVLSAADTELAALAAAQERAGTDGLSMRLGNFLQLKHHMLLMGLSGFYFGIDHHSIMSISHVFARWQRGSPIECVRPNVCIYKHPVRHFV